ncbi:hypothetical protein SE17_11160 [Kouleothrix aurantiaca]|uniref:NB-ARC domain-containing protein n=1 Tax=Kouleothrix aurantiaca TaxID=186479 RepID=A0A0P9HEK6_9CHLR|nr:hypothetical protein SE17_11160 [Kouleothrix aurantiaca]
MVAGDKVGGDKVMGDKLIIETGGGDYAKGNIDKRQGTFIDNQIIQPALSQALHQLRAPVGDFVGREQKIEQITQALSQAASSGAAAAISGVRGMGGIGKTELAYVVGNRLKDSFPDAQLFIELRGASSSPLSPEAALQQVIRSFEREAKLPDDLSQLKGIYSSVLAGKRVLILADDAKDDAQIRPLLPPAGCALLVTSRTRFSLPGMTPFDLETLPKDDAQKLLLKICPRIGEHAEKLAKLCGYLPLALRVSASLLANSGRKVARYLDQLGAERLKHLSDPDNPNDPVASVEASLHLSYRSLEQAAQQALSQLSVFPMTFDLAAAVAVLKVSSDIEGILELLERRCLLQQDIVTQRLSLHDLVRAFAVMRLANRDAVQVRHAQYYARVAMYVEDSLFLKNKALEGLKLFDLERENIDTGWAWAHSKSGTLAGDSLLYIYSNATTHIGSIRYDAKTERLPQLDAALAASRRIGNDYLIMITLGNLGATHRYLGNFENAAYYYGQTLKIARQLNNVDNVARALSGIATACIGINLLDEAIDLYEQRLKIALVRNDKYAESVTLMNLSGIHIKKGDYSKATIYCEKSLIIMRMLGYKHIEGRIIGNLATINLRLGNTQAAIDYYKQALAIMQAIGDRDGETTVTKDLGLAVEMRDNASDTREI